MYNPKETLRVEHYHQVKPYLSGALNHVFQQQIVLFNELYQEHGGQIGSHEHNVDKLHFAKIVGEGLIRDFSDKDNITFTGISSKTTFKCLNLPNTFNIKSHANFGQVIMPLPANISPPPYNPKNDEEIRIESFGNFTPHQTTAFNFHLKEGLLCFDKTYKEAGGQIGSFIHRYDRMEFAKLIVDGLLTDLKNKSDDFVYDSIEGKTTYQCMGITDKVTVTQKSTFGDDIKTLPNTHIFKLEY